MYNYNTTTTTAQPQKHCDKNKSTTPSINNKNNKATTIAQQQKHCVKNISTTSVQNNNNTTTTHSFLISLPNNVDNNGRTKTVDILDPNFF